MRSGPIPGSSYYIEKDEVYLGRDLSNDLPVPDPEISRRHARFLRKPDGIYIEDLGSTNGTFVNGVRLTGPQLLQHGDLITLAENTVMSFEVKEEATQPTRVSTQTFEPGLYEVPKPAQAAKKEYEPVAAPTPQQPVAQAPSVEKPKKGMGWFATLLLVLLIVIVLVALVLIFMPASWW